jgi:hypothetical protein
MRHREIVDDGHRRTVDWKEQVRRYAERPQQHAFVHVVPAETGLSRTIWVSQSETYPAFLVARKPGRQIHPPKDVQVYGLGETTPFDDVNTWLENNRHLLPLLAAQEIDIGHFYDGMVRSPASALQEMVTLPRCETRLS